MSAVSRADSRTVPPTASRCVGADVRRLLVELAFAAADHRLQRPLRAFIAAIPDLIDDERDRALCLARLHMQCGDLAAARACLADRTDPQAMFMAALIAGARETGPRLLHGGPGHAY